MSKGFDANRDCVTGMEIPVEVVLKAALDEPFDGTEPQSFDRISWAYGAALTVLKDLSWRNGIGPDLKRLDENTRERLCLRILMIIHEAAEGGHFSDDVKAILDRMWKAEDRVREAYTKIADLEYQLADARAKPVSLAEAQRRIDAANAVIAEIEADRIQGRVLGADVKADADGRPTTTLSEIVEPDHENKLDNPITVTTTGNDVLRVLYAHARAIDFIEDASGESEAA